MNNLSIDKTTVKLRGYTAKLGAAQGNIDLNEPLYLSVELVEKPSFINDEIKLEWKTVFCNIMNNIKACYFFSGHDEKENKKINDNIQSKIEENLSTFEAKFPNLKFSGFLVDGKDILFKIQIDSFDESQNRYMKIVEYVEYIIKKISDVIDFINYNQSMYFAEKMENTLKRNTKKEIEETMLKHFLSTHTFE
ncbi:hypothetical protein LHV18_12530 [Providencia rettgeri]|uniref:hypothetical protein n=1 Tax=Providencia rettgeri TaxID=587 RepID=UPI001CFEA83B|nr:hypothetical protein [Providencia rettgeri]EIU7557604.1 hypothetical protein [Providencia rettgeri]MCB4841453.1 hypothetical protein [Providencia rettgeri]MDH2394618.1 hypothetical protein [Providencia rettgeri]